MELDRRSFLKAGALIGAGGLIGPRLVFGARNGTPADTVVVIFLRGGLDPLQAIVPYGDSDYFRLRPTIAIPQPGAANGALALDNLFGLHPSLAPLLPIYQGRQLAVVHATGLKHDERSHFACQDDIETGIHDLAGTGSHAGNAGWLNRHVMEVGDPGGFFAIGMGSALQAAVRGDASALAMQSLSSFAFSSTSTRKSQMEDRLYAMYGRDNDVGFSSRSALDSIDYIATVKPSSIPVANGAVYPTGTFGNQMKEVAQLIKAGMGLRVACVDLNGFDHHDGITTRLPPLLDQLARAMAAFHTDLGKAMGDVTVVTMTEFGRRAFENASGGTDHGCGSMMLLMGGGVLGGMVYADWPGLKDTDLFNGDLDVTVDYRTVLTELMQKRMASDLDGGIFPDVLGQPQVGCFSSTRSNPNNRIPTPRGSTAALT